MTPTPHGQVPEALIDLIDAYAETRHRCGGIYNARTEAARNAVIEALSGVQALSAAPSVLSDEAILNRTGCIDYSPGTAGYDLELIRWYRTQIASPAPQQSRPLSHPNREFPGSAKGAAITSESPTPPAEQAAPKAAPVTQQAGYAEVIECGNSYAKVKLKGEAFGSARVGDIFYTAPQPAPDCHHRPPCDECAALAVQGGK